MRHVGHFDFKLVFRVVGAQALAGERVPPAPLELAPLRGYMDGVCVGRARLQVPGFRPHEKPT